MHLYVERSYRLLYTMYIAEYVCLRVTVLIFPRHISWSSPFSRTFDRISIHTLNS